MSLQELAAVIGITEVALRSVSALYEFLKDLQDAPLEIERIKAEASTLERTLQYLSSLDAAYIELRDLSQRTGLAVAVNRCGDACHRLLQDLYRWTPNSKHTTISRIQFRLHKRTIENVKAEISATKQTTILALGVAQICLQLGKPLSESEKILRIRQGRAEIDTMPTSLTPESNIGRKRNPNVMASDTDSEDREMIVYNPQDRNVRKDSKTEQAEETLAEEARKAAAAAAEAVKAEISITKSTTGEGDGNFIGADKAAVDKLAKLKIESSHTKKGNGNFIGVGETGYRPGEEKKSRSSRTKPSGSK